MPNTSCSVDDNSKALVANIKAQNQKNFDMECIEQQNNPLRKVIHIDMDAFYASVEQRDNPMLRNRAVIVGGKPNGRGVVAACSYEAREYGVHSAMPSAQAFKKCPHAIFVKPRFSEYQAVSKQLNTIFKSFSPLVEPLSLDEAYIDVSNVSILGGSALRIAKEIRAQIKQQTGLVASAGVSYNKFLAKIASDHDKPDGLFCILPADGETFIAGLPIGRFYGVGRATEARMQELGIFNGADLRRWTLAELTQELGKSAHYYFNIARGIDNRPVRSSRTRKSLGTERTFSENLTSAMAMQDKLNELATQLVSDMLDKGLQGSTLSVKVRFANFDTYTRSHSQPGGIMTAEDATRQIPFLLARALAENPAQSVRLLGVSISGLKPIDPDAITQLSLKL